MLLQSYSYISCRKLKDEVRPKKLFVCRNRGKQKTGSVGRSFFFNAHMEHDTHIFDKNDVYINRKKIKIGYEQNHVSVFWSLTKLSGQ